MGYSDQKFYSRPLTDVADSKVATGTSTASGTNNLASAFPLIKFKRATQVNDIRVIVQAAPAANLTNVNFIFLNGTNTFGTLLVGTNAVNSIVIGTITNTAVLTTSTVTNTFANGSTGTATITTTTNYSQFAAAGQPTITINGTATASGQNYGSYEMFFEDQELYTAP